MKQALALTFLSSMTCLVAWDAEAAPHAPTEAPSHAAKVNSHHVDKKKTVKPDARHVEKKKAAKAAPSAKANAHIPLRGAAKADGSFTLDAGGKGAKAEPVHAVKAKKAEPSRDGKGKHKADLTPNDKASERQDLHGDKDPQRLSYWLAANPHVPLAVIEGREIRSVGKRDRDCGTEGRWARPRSHWNAVSAWGQVVGSTTVSGSDLDDATGCHEVSFKGKEGAEPHVLFVSADSAWRPSESAVWTPKDEERARFEQLSTTLEKLWVNKRPLGKPLPLQKRTMFFKTPALSGASDKRPTRWAVTGGPILLVAYLGEHDHWKVASVENPLGAANSYQPVGVFDMNGDKIPEIIYHSNEGPTFGDSVLALDRDTLGWEDAAVSPGGAISSP